MHIIAFTGHRPQDLPAGTQAAFAASLDALKMGARTDLHFVVGGALGVDTWAADYAIAHDIPFDLVLPFSIETMGKFWSEADRVRLHTISLCAETVEVLRADGYDVAEYQRRNIAMVDKADAVFAVWSGKRAGGTWNCVRYAVRKGVPTYNLWPLAGKLRPIKAL